MARLLILFALMTISYVVGCATDFYVEAEDALERLSHVDAKNWVPLGPAAGLILRDRGRTGMAGRLFAYVDGEWMPNTVENPTGVTPAD